MSELAFSVFDQVKPQMFSKASSRDARAEHFVKRDKSALHAFADMRFARLLLEHALLLKFSQRCRLNSPID